MSNVHPIKAAEQGPTTLVRFLASLSLIETTIAWLLSKHVSVIGFGCTRFGPVITVAAHPAAYVAAKGAAERRGYRQIGQLRYERWSFKARGDVEVTWEEVVCVH